MLLFLIVFQLIVLGYEEVFIISSNFPFRDALLLINSWGHVDRSDYVYGLTPSSPYSTG